MDGEDEESGTPRRQPTVDREEELLEILTQVPAFRAAIQGGSDPPASDPAVTGSARQPPANDGATPTADGGATGSMQGVN